MSNNPHLDGISIVITYYNETLLLDKCVKAISNSLKKLEPQQQNVEVIIIDDASTYPPGKLPDQEKFRIVRLSKNGGVGEARNAGLRLSRYNYIHFLDADVFICEPFLKNLFQLLDINPPICAIQGHYSEIPGNDKPTWFNWYMSLSWHHNSIVADGKKEGLSDMVNSGCITFRKDYFLSIGGYQSYAKSGGEEHEISRRIKRGDLQHAPSLINFHTSDSFYQRAKKVWRRGRNYWSGVIKNGGIPSSFKSACLVRAISAVSATTGLAVSPLSPLWGFLIFFLATIGGIIGDRGESYFMAKKKGLLFCLTAILFRQAEYTVASLSVGYGLITTIRGKLFLNARQF
jgi:glycosyltransferase involved in cell wall biosynthesis